MWIEKKQAPFVITNNPAFPRALGDRLPCICNESWSYGEVLLQVRDKIHEGYHLLTHPLAGSLKPNQTPYRSVLVGRIAPDRDLHRSVSLIEQALETYHQFHRQRPTPLWSLPVREHFQLLDLSILQAAVDRAAHRNTIKQSKKH